MSFNLKKCIVIPDSFKGTMTSMEVCRIMERAIRKHFPNCLIHSIPVADGGEGTVECFVAALEMERIKKEVTGPYGERLTAAYAVKDTIAVIETASVAGLPYAESIGHLSPREGMTYGLGELIRDAVGRGCKTIILGLGGSCTNDGGTGMALAAGVVFYDSHGREFTPRPDTLCRIAGINTEKAEELLAGCTVIGMCDIDNPMYGESGAAYIFAPQKGADPADVRILNENLIILGQVLEKHTGKQIAQMKGSGAAGALGAGILGFLGGKLESGIDTVLDQIEYEKMLQGADMVFTGEGRFDSQSLRGKVIAGTSKRAGACQVPVTAVVGSIEPDTEKAYSMGVTSVFSINQKAEDFQTSKYSSKENLHKTMDNLMRFYKSAR